MENIFHINGKFKVKISGDTNSSCHFLLHTTRRYCNNFTGGHNTLSGTNRQILTPETTTSTSGIFIGEFPPWDIGFLQRCKLFHIYQSNFKLSRREFQDTRGCRRFKEDLLSYELTQKFCSSQLQGRSNKSARFSLKSALSQLDFSHIGSNILKTKPRSLRIALHISLKRNLIVWKENMEFHCCRIRIVMILSSIIHIGF